MLKNNIFILLITLNHLCLILIHLISCTALDRCNPDIAV